MADTHRKEENRLKPFDGGISAPAITGGELSNTLAFGPKPAKPTESERLAAIREQKFTDWLGAKREELQQQRTDAIKMARFNALGNVLTTMVQPLGWTAGGVTGGVQPYDDRQYLDAFNRAVKASDDLRNIGSMQSEYEFKIADENYQRALAEEQRQKKRAEENEDYKRHRQLDAEFGVNRAKTGQALFDERTSKVIDAWTIHNKTIGMTLAEYFDYIEATTPGFFGDRKPNRDELARLEKEIASRPRTTTTTTTRTRRTDSSDDTNWDDYARS